MELTLEACLGMPPTEVLPIVFQEQIASGRVNIRDYAPIGYITGLMEYCLPKVTKKNSAILVRLLKLEHEVHPEFFYMIQQAYDNEVTKELEEYKVQFIKQLEAEEKRKLIIKELEKSREG